MERLQVRTEEIDIPGGRLTDQLTDLAGPAWIHGGDGMIGYGEAVRYVPATIADADNWWHDVAGRAVVQRQLDDPPSGSGLIAFGSFVFDPEHTAGQSVLWVPEVVIGCRNGRAWRTTIQRLNNPSPVSRDDQLAAGRGDRNNVPAGQRAMITYADGPLSPLEWQQAVTAAVQKIEAQVLDKVVLSRQLLAVADQPIDPTRLVATLAKDYPRCWTYHIDGLVGATPEMLIRRENGLATSRVLAGTIQRSPGAAQDLALAAALSQSGKDLAEHRFAVASVAAALGPHSLGMNVPDAPSVLELPNLLHLATDVTAAVDSGASSLTLAAALHPSAAVCGTPTGTARAAIAELEHLDRDRYAGPIGWIDADGDGEWAIALRCGKIDAFDPARIRLYAGCGIVAGSDPDAELAESNAKLLVMREALET